MSYATFGVEIVHHLRDIIKGLKLVDLSLVPTGSPFWLNVKVSWHETVKLMERRVLNMFYFEISENFLKVRNVKIKKKS